MERVQMKMMLRLPMPVLNMVLFYQNIGYLLNPNGNTQLLDLQGFVSIILTRGKRNILGQVILLELRKVETLVTNSQTLSKGVEILAELQVGLMMMLKSLQMFVNIHQMILACMEWQAMFPNGSLTYTDLLQIMRSAI